MWENIIVILLIILFSYLFRQSGSTIGNNNKKINTFDTQMLFILLSLGALIFYKMTFINKLEKDKKTDSFKNIENFNTLDNVVNEFSKNSSPQSSESKSQDEPFDSNLIREELQNLRNMINNMSEKKDEKINLDGQEINEQNLIAFQNLQLNNLEKIVDEIKQNRLDAEDKNINKTFKKIPVYNSCYVINADNSVSGGNTTSEQEDNKENNESDNSGETKTDEQSNVINQSSGNSKDISLREQNIKEMTERLGKLEDFFSQLMNKFTNIKLLV